MIERNRYMTSYVNGIIKSFRYLNSDVVTIRINGLQKILEIDSECLEFIKIISSYNFIICVEGENNDVSDINITCTSGDDISHFIYQLDNIPHLIEISSKTNLSLLTLIIMRIISIYICKCKTIYKALVLDLDDTLWNGTLSEIGIQKIKENLSSDEGTPFVSFMNFVCNIAKELGVYIAICSRNNVSLVKDAFEQLDETIFPLKNQIDCIVANNGDKSDNLIKIAEQLSILPNAIIFIDDNRIIRDEVRDKVPEILVPEWIDHQDLILQIISGGYFDRSELSISAQNRRKKIKIIQEEKSNNTLPELYIKIHEDKEHIEAQKLYAKSNQFKLTQLNNIFCENATSIYFEIFRKSGESLGICSTITYYAHHGECILLNWAISCRFFEIGLEEFVLHYMLENFGKYIDVIWQPNNVNKKVESLVNKYYGSVITDDCSSVPNESNVFIPYLPYNESTKKMLQEINDRIGSYSLYYISDEKKLLKSNTNLKIFNNE